MSKPATSGTEPEVRRLSRGSKGWFGWMAGMWVVFFVLLNSGRIDDIATWIRDLPLLLEIVVWVVFFPWVLATAVWTSDWSEGLRLTLVILFAAAWTIVSIPRPKPVRKK
jgi:hypothetical protein